LSTGRLRHARTHGSDVRVQHQLCAPPRGRR
jgi:hypothetical protein